MLWYSGYDILQSGTSVPVFGGTCCLALHGGSRFSMAVTFVLKKSINFPNFSGIWLKISSESKAGLF